MKQALNLYRVRSTELGRFRNKWISINDCDMLGSRVVVFIKRSRTEVGCRVFVANLVDCDCVRCIYMYLINSV